MLVVRPDLDLVVELYGSSLDDFDFVLRKIESNKKWIKFSPKLHELMVRLKIENYPELYQCEGRIISALFRAVFENNEQIIEYIESFKTLPYEEQILKLNDYISEISELGTLIDEKMPHIEDMDWTEAGQAKARNEWEKLTSEEQQQALRVGQYGLMFSMATFYNYFAVMVHGRKLTQLVTEAIAGDEESFCLAIHIDKNILHRIPYFRERYQRAINHGEQDFLEAVSRWQAKPQLTGRIRHPRLYILFAILDGCQWLDELKHREILDICDRVNLDRYENRIETENALTKRIVDYRKLQKTFVKSMP